LNIDDDGNLSRLDAKPMPGSAPRMPNSRARRELRLQPSKFASAFPAADPCARIGKEAGPCHHRLQVKKRSSENKTPGNEAPIVVTPRAIVRVTQQITSLFRPRS
jgi:hypothetical protein